MGHSWELFLEKKLFSSIFWVYKLDSEFCIVLGSKSNRFFNDFLLFFLMFFTCVAFRVIFANVCCSLVKHRFVRSSDDMQYIIFHFFRAYFARLFLHGFSNGFGKHFGKPKWSKISKNMYSKTYVFLALNFLDLFCDFGSILGGRGGPTWSLHTPYNCLQTLIQVARGKRPLRAHVCECRA